MSCWPLLTKWATKTPLAKTRGGLGAGGVTRTRDLLITSEMLYQLSYTSIFLYFLVFSELFNQFDQLIQEWPDYTELTRVLSSLQFDQLITNQLLYRLSYSSALAMTVAVSIFVYCHSISVAPSMFRHKQAGFILPNFSPEVKGFYGFAIKRCHLLQRWPLFIAKP